MDNLVSVIVTSYNHGKYIEQCLRSIFAQTYSNLELYVIDDGSSDDSVEIIQTVLKDAPFETTFLIQENAGVAVTRNRALDLVTGDFVLFVDSDDFLSTSYVEQLLKVAEKTQGDIIYCDLWDDDKKEIHMKAKPFELTTFLEGNYIINTSLIRRSVIKDARYDLELNRKFLEDYDFMMTLILANHAKPVYAEGVALNYRVLEDSISRKENHTTRDYFYQIYFYILKKHINEAPEEIFAAIKTNLMILENRLAELIDHLDGVTDHVHNLEQIRADKEQEIAKVHEFLEEFKKDNQHLVEVNEKLAADNHTLVKTNEELVESSRSLVRDNQILAQDKELIMNSRSYRLGNALLKPIHLTAKAVKNPRLIKVGLKRGSSRIKQYFGRIPSPKKIGLTMARENQRKKNNYIDPKRFLIYVIYENQPRLQEYKVIFLEGLKELVDEVLIVVNGELPQADIERLAAYGQVQTRENSGYDTAGFRYGVLTVGKERLSQFDELLLVNDTNVGPIGDLKETFAKMAQQRLDFWGITYGEEQPDITGYNPYGYIPIHLQSYFLVIERSLLIYDGFYEYWEKLNDTNAREKAIGRHETVFTKHFADLGFKHGAVTDKNQDSAIYIHPLQMLQEGVPLVKYTAFSNYNDDKYLWQGLVRQSEVPQLVKYLDTQTDYPMSVVEKIIADFKQKENEPHILIIDGVENIIPQCTRYRVLNKAEQLRNFGLDVKVVNNSAFQLKDAEYANLIVIYRCGYSELLGELCRLAKQFNKTVLYDIDDLVIDTKYTDQLEYTQSISKLEKANYDASVDNYGRMLKLCDGAITSTTKLQEELRNYQTLVLLNRNVASQELAAISDAAIESYTNETDKVKIGYFSGSITHNENFELIKPALLQLLADYPNVELHLVGHLDIPKELEPYQTQFVTHDYVEWHELPRLVREVDINLAPLVDSIFNQAKSEIKWSEAALVKVPTVASNLGAFADMVQDGVTGVLANDDEWYEKLAALVESRSQRQMIAESAYDFVRKNCTTRQKDEFIQYVVEA